MPALVTWLIRSGSRARLFSVFFSRFVVTPPHPKPDSEGQLFDESFDLVRSSGAWKGGEILRFLDVMENFW